MKAKGLLCGLVSGICWSLDTILLGYVLLASPFEEMVFLAPFLSTFLHDFFSSLWVMLYLIVTKKMKKMIQALKRRSGWFIVLAAILGGPVGMSGYLFSIQYIGSAYTATISAMYPAIGALFGFLLLKDRLTRKGIVGLVLVIVSTILLGFTSPENPSNLVLGFFCALLCVFGWGMECVISAYGMSEEIDSDVALAIRQVTSVLVYILVILPFIGGYQGLNEILVQKEILLKTLGVAFIGTVSYLCYYKAISLIGPTRAMALNISYSAWAIILGLFFFHQEVNPIMLIPCGVIIAGSIMTAKDE